MKSAVALVTCGLLALGAGHVQADQQKLPSGTSYDQIGQKIEDYYKEHEKNSAGMATTVIDKDGQTIYQNNFGYMDKENKQAVDDNPVFEWEGQRPKSPSGSVSCSSGQDGGFGLNSHQTDINQHCYDVLNPKSWTNNYLKDLVLYCTGLSPFSFTLIRLLL